MVKKNGPKQPQGEKGQTLKANETRENSVMLLCMVTPFFLLTPFSFDKLFKK